MELEFKLGKPLSDEDLAKIFGSFEDEQTEINHPEHYNREGAMECIDEMILIFGIEAVMNFCLCNAWKYRYRASEKGGEDDLRKSDWYIAEYERLLNE